MRFNVFILGSTKAGKTTLAQGVAAALGLQVISASTWIKLRYTPSPAAEHDQAMYLDEITRFSCAELTRDPDACIDFIRHSYDLDQDGFIIEGIRNPRDFARLFRPERDLVVTLSQLNPPIRPTDFETEGLAVIRAFLDWHIKMGVMSTAHDMTFRLSYDASPEPASTEKQYLNLTETIEQVAAWIRVMEPTVRPTSDKTRRARAHVELPTPGLRAWVENRVLHDDDPACAGWLPCRLFAVSSYPGHALTFEILLDNGAVFSYVPLHRLRHTDPDVVELNPRFELSDLVYRNCPDEHIAVNHYAVLAGLPVRAYLKHAKRWLTATYMTTIDWYLDNNLVHLLCLENGQFAALPSHKVLFGGDQDALPPYQALHATWFVKNP